MTIQDPISDLLTQIRNGYSARKDFIIVYSSKLKVSLVDLLKNEFFLKDYIILDQDSKKTRLKIFLRYYGKNMPILRRIVRISKSSVKIYKSCKSLPKVSNGFGIAVISTSLGLLTDKKARELGVGGEVLCIVE
ncbi:30S ribosomal protein S8 [Candidatus Azoamicus ciliaticola]|uniref:Small ribosomal subunit protein uS8 n=1 Tax=Candidatus Azoamicus ciliaticola TaxID=2652803 RepID=A0A6J5JYC3_9GAMM|nr:30S ribosomal protein S8 [Candidatus Azoamicus ciliaticola]CAB3976343.1 30S ribosomal protein S8 [Candidatus Azoamicus ciliaticola]